MLVNYVSIKPCDGVFGAYKAVYESEILDAVDLLDGCAGEVYELGEDGLPDWVVDIRSRIHNEPSRVFVERSNDSERVMYFGFEGAE